MALAQPEPTATAALRLCALLACHDRREMTLRCLHSHAIAAAEAGLAPQAVLVDDGSRDGTAAAVRAAFDWVEVIDGDGSLYWCRAMHRATERAQRRGFDAYLWLNDDSTLEPDALVRLRDCAARFAPGPVIVVGTLADGAQPSYGGRIAPSCWRRTTWRLLEPSDAPQSLHTMDGNLVWISAAALARVGNLDAAFEHAMGDTDYGLRARALGVPLWLAPGVLGQCSSNRQQGNFGDRALPLAARWRAMLSPKGLPWRSWLRFTRRHAGPVWPLFFAWPYLRLLAGAAGGPK